MDRPLRQAQGLPIRQPGRVELAAIQKQLQCILAVAVGKRLLCLLEMSLCKLGLLFVTDGDSGES